LPASLWAQQKLSSGSFVFGEDDVGDGEEDVGDGVFRAEMERGEVASNEGDDTFAFRSRTFCTLPLFRVAFLTNCVCCVFIFRRCCCCSCFERCREEAMVRRFNSSSIFWLDSKREVLIAVVFSVLVVSMVMWLCMCRMGGAFVSQV